jgi:hypothetical protein
VDPVRDGEWLSADDADRAEQLGGCVDLFGEGGRPLTGTRAPGDPDLRAGEAVLRRGVVEGLEAVEPLEVLRHSQVDRRRGRDDPGRDRLGGEEGARH